MSHMFMSIYVSMLVNNGDEKLAHELLDEISKITRESRWEALHIQIDSEFPA